jgi:hypothetical protein
VRVHPSELLTESGMRIADELAVVELQSDAPIRIVVRRREQEPPDDACRAKLLVELTAETILGTFTRFAFPPGELPESGEVRVIEPSRDEVGRPALDDRGSDED